MNDIQKNGSGGLLEKGIDIMKDPTSSTAAKAGAVGIVAIGAIALVAKPHWMLLENTDLVVS